jgi:hypothetical protein
MTRARGNALQNALARYLQGWWPHAESAGAGRNGSDVLGTPGVVWECKTAVDFKRDFRPAAWVAQSLGHMAAAHDGEPPNVPVVVYFPPGVGENRTAHAMAIVPLHVMMQVLQAAGYAAMKQEV